MTQPLNSALTGTLHDCHGACAAHDAGHALSSMQEVLAAATPSKWRDAIVVSVAASGWIEIALLDDDSTQLLWNHGDLTAELSIGEPVVVHAVYEVLNAHGSKHSVLRADAF